MKISHRSKQFAAVRVMQSDARKRRAADAFRRRHIDHSLKRALNALVKPDERPDPLVVVQCWRGPLSRLALMTGLSADAIRAKALKPESAGVVMRVQLRSNEPVFGAVKRMVLPPVVEDY